MENERDGSVFIRESKRLRNKHIAVKILIDLPILAICGFICYAMLFDRSVIEQIIGVIVFLAANGAVMWYLTDQDKKEFKRFSEFIYNMDDQFFSAVERQAKQTEKMFGVFYLLEDFLYVCSKNAFIPYTDIKKLHSTFTSVNLIPAEAVVRIYCFSGKIYSVSVRSVFEYRQRKNEFDDLLDRNRRRCFEKYSKPN